MESKISYSNTFKKYNTIPSILDTRTATLCAKNACVKCVKLTVKNRPSEMQKKTETYRNENNILGRTSVTRAKYEK